MDKILKNVIRETIAREFVNYQNDIYNDLKKNAKLYEEYEMYTSKAEDLEEKLKKILSKEQHELLEELLVSRCEVGVIESEASFKKGLILGVTELNYLNQVGIEITFI